MGSLRIQTVHYFRLSPLVLDSHRSCTRSRADATACTEQTHNRSLASMAHLFPNIDGDGEQNRTCGGACEAICLGNAACSKAMPETSLYRNNVQ
jgi:hypothetical protein